MKKNGNSTSSLRKGGAKKRWVNKCRRFRIMHHLRDTCKWTWHDIGKRFKISRQAAFKFYKEHKNLI